MIKNIVFDMGNVIMDFDPVKFVNRFPELSKEDKKLLLDEVFYHDEWNKLDYGFFKNDEEYAKRVKERTPKRLHEYVDKLVLDWYKPALVVEGTEEVIAKIKEKGYKLYLLSNAGPSHDIYWPTIPASKYFDGKFVSAYVKKWKPNTDFYEAFFEHFGLKPSECIFIDNLEENVESGRKLGMEGIIFTSASDLEKKLGEMGII